MRTMLIYRVERCTEMSSNIMTFWAILYYFVFVAEMVGVFCLLAKKKKPKLWVLYDFLIATVLMLVNSGYIWFMREYGLWCDAMEIKIYRYGHGTPFYIFCSLPAMLLVLVCFAEMTGHIRQKIIRGIVEYTGFIAISISMVIFPVLLWD